MLLRYLLLQKDEFVTAQYNGYKAGLRCRRRRVGPLHPVNINNVRIG